jgi:hypothetical protein
MGGRGFTGCGKTLLRRFLLPSAAKAVIQNKALHAALKHCATQSHVDAGVFLQPVKPSFKTKHLMQR